MSNATPAQISFLKKLATDRDCSALANLALADIDSIRDDDTDKLCWDFTKQQASSLIDQLKQQPWRQRNPAQQQIPVEPVTEPGVYVSPDGVFIVKPNRDKTRLYAKRLVEAPDRMSETDEVIPFDAVYEAGAIFKLAPAMKMSLEDGKALTARYGKCICCGRKLKAAKSVDAGIGPVCRTYFAQ